MIRNLNIRQANKTKGCMAFAVCVCFLLMFFFSVNSFAVTRTVPAEHATISAAITASSSGDVIDVSAGTYNENIDFGGKDITIQSVSGAATTLIRGTSGYNNNPVVSFISGETSSAVLDGFTLDNNTSNASNTRGITITNATPTIQNCIIENNQAYYASPGQGAGIKITGTGGATIIDTIIQNNSVGTSGEKGGGIYHIGSSTLTITGSIFESNLGNKGGGGLYMESSTANISTTTFKSNTNNADNGGGAIYMGGTSPSLTLSKSHILGNWTDGGSNNSDAGGIKIASGTATITNTVIAGNVTKSAWQADGGGIYVEAGATLNLYFSTVADNYAYNHGGGIYAGGTENISNSIVYGNLSDHGTAGIYEIAPSGTRTNVQITDPTFVTNAPATGGTPTTTGNYDLQASSNSIDTGDATNAPADDIDGTSRPINALYDKGAYEYGVGGGGNTAPLGGYTADNVIPTAQVTQSSSGDAVITINFRAQDAETEGVTLNTFEYSVDGGSTWNAPTNADVSTSLSTNWEDNGSSYTSATDWTGTVHSFTFDTDHADVTGISGTDQSDIQIRFTLNDGTDDSAAAATSQSFQVDDVAPTATFTSAEYTASSDTLVITGTNFTTIATASTDIKSYVDWAKFVWDINADNATTANTTFVEADVTSLTVTDATTLTLIFTGAKGTAIEATSGYGDTGGTDSIDVTAGFSKDAAGNAATTDVVADGALTIATMTVCASGCTYTTIQAAIDASSNGETITVKNGTYSENINFNGKLVTLVSENGAALTKIQGTGAADAVVTFDSGETSSAVLDGFTIDNQGSGASARGIKIIASSEPTIQNSIIEGNVLTIVTNSDPNYGGGIYINTGGATIISTTIGQSGTANQANKGSGIYALNGTSITLNNSNVTFNSGRTYAGIYLQSMSGTSTLTNTNVDNNNANGYNVGGIYANASSISITGGSISNNSGTFGAGLRLENVPTITIINNVAINSNAAGATIAGGIYSIDSPMDISNGTTINSNVSRDGAGINMTGAYAGFPANTKTTIDSTTINGNNAQGYVGGGVYSNGSPVEITGSTITNNSGQSGSGLRLVSAPLVTVITNTNINSNTGTAQPGGGVYSSSSPMTITGGTISNNSGSRNGGGIYLTGSYAAFAPGTKTTISGTTIDANASSNYTGGGIYSNALPMAFSGGATVSNNSGSSGGGIYLASVSDTTTFDNVTVSSNVTSAGNNGGGLYATGSPLSISNSTFSANTSGRAGAAMFITGVYATTDTIADSTIKNNVENENYAGGAIATNMKLQIDRSYLIGNRGSQGAGLNTSNTLTVTNSIISGNVADRATTNDGGGIYASGTTIIMNSTFSGNYAYDDGGGIWTNGTITNSIMYGNTAGDAVLKQYGGTPTITYSDVEGSGGGGSNFDVDPVFVDYQFATLGSPTDTGDFHLQITSTIIDQATSTGAPANDIDGGGRPAGSGYDIGADEYGGNFPPYGGYTANDVIPTAQVSQSSSGDAIVTINFRSKDNDGENTTLNTFQYSVDGGSTWNAPTNGDASTSLSTNWNNNGGGGYSSATDWTGTVHNFTFDTDHADVTGIAGTDQSDIQVRFTLNDGTANSAAPATSENFQVDDVAPTATITSAGYNKNSDTLTITGTNFTTIATASTDIKSYVDWSKFVWDINGDNATTANITFVEGDVTSLTVTDATTLTLLFTGAKGTAIEGTAGYGSTGGADTLDVTAGFSKDVVGNAATTDGVADGTLITNSAPFGGYTADNVIPTAQVTQSGSGDGIMTINFRIKDGQTDTTTLNTFEYSVDGGSIWNAPTNADASNSLSVNWEDNGSSYSSAADWSGTVHSFTFDTDHADVAGMAGVDQSDVQVRFTVNDAVLDSAAAATSQNFQVDNVSPTVTITSAAYTPGADTLVVTGTNFTTIADAATDVKSYVDWTKFVWDINGDNATTANVTFVEGDITSATVTNATTLTIIFTGAKGTALEGTAGYGTTGGADTLDVTAGFSIDVVGNVSSTDAVADAAISTPVVSYTVTKTADTNDGTCDADCSLREAVAAANALSDLNTIDFIPNGTFTLTGSAGEDSNNSGDLDIVYPVTIAGNGIANTIISGNNGDRIFHFQATATGSQIDDVKIINGEALTLNGGCIYSDINLTVTGSTLDNCKAQNAGGAIYTNGATLTDVTITNSYSDITGGGVHNITNALTINGTANTLNYNYLNNSTQTNDFGGHIWSDADVTITNATFNGRASGYDAYSGGAIYMNGTTHTLNITNATFDSFYANGHGGVLYMSGGILTDVDFTNNVSNNRGGAIVNLTNALTITTTSGTNAFTNNWAENGTNSTWDYGGQIYSDADLTIENAVFTGRTTGYDAYVGGAIYMVGTTHTLNITNATFDSFYAAGHGGALYMSGGTLTDVDFTNNVSNNRGGAIVNYTNALTITTTSGSNIFTNNWAESGTDSTWDYGGHIYSDADVTITNADFTGRASGYDAYVGGAVYIAGTTRTLNITNATFDSFYTAGHGGALYMTGGTLTDVDFTNNTTNNRGGAIVNYNNALTITTTSGSNIFSNNWAENGADSTWDYGGHIYSDADLTVTNADFSGRAGTSLDAYNGGAIYVNGTNTLALNNATFDEFRTNGNGGAIFMNGGTLTDVDVTNTYSNNLGGAIYNGANALTITTTSGTNIFSNNWVEDGNYDSGDSGGHIYSSGNLNITNGVFTGRSGASYDANRGGAIYINGGAVNLNVTNSTFKDFDAKKMGGAIYMQVGTISGSTFSNNKSLFDDGGAIYSAGAGVKFINSTFSANTAVSDGGAIYSNSSCTIKNSTFYSNEGTATADAIRGNSCTMTNSIVTQTSTTTSMCTGVTSGGYNLHHDGDGLDTDNTECFTHGTGDINTDSLINATLADNGGPTMTHALPLTPTISPAIDAGDNATCADADVGNVDQRGGARPYDGDGDLTATCDIGAYEYLPSNSAPFGGYTANNVIPTAQVTQLSNGDAIVTVQFRIKDTNGDGVTLNTFEYSVDGGSVWNAPTNADASASLSTNWEDNGSSYSSATDWTGTVHSFTFDADHADVTGIAGTDQSDIQVRFTVNDGTLDSTAPATSQNFQVDDVTPTATITSAAYTAASDTLVITGTNFTTIAATSTDIKSYVDWTKFVWDINGDNATTANVTFVVGDVTSLTVTDATTLTLVLAGAKGTSLEGSAGYGATGGVDTLDVTAGFSKDLAGNAATTDGVADAPLTTAINSTAAGTATAVSGGNNSIDVSMPYTDDEDNDSTYTVDYKLSSEPTTWTNWVTTAPNAASPYTTTITGLIVSTSYDVRVTYVDTDGVTGTAVQTISNIFPGITPGAVAYWKFDETSGSTAADSIGSNDGTVYNATWTASGKSGYALSFDGTGDYVEVPNSAPLNITEEVTVELWFKPAVTYNSSLSDYVILLERQWSANIDSYFVTINGDGKLHMGSMGGNIQSTQASWTAGTWYHIVGTYRDVSGTYSGELYVNGVAQSLSVNSYDNMAGGTQKIGIGGSDRHINYNGLIDEVLVYNTTLTSSQALARFNAYNGAPMGGYTADNVIPTAQVTQSANGDGIVTINFRAQDADSDNVTLNTFEYSVDGGSVWNAPTNADASASLSTNWEDNGSSYSSATDWTGTVHSFTFDSDHADVTGISGTDQSDIQIRFTVNDGTVDSAVAATSQNFQVDDVAPTATITSATYTAASDTMVITGTNFTTIATASTDIKSYVDWTKFVWDINGDGATTANITFAEADVTSLTVTDATTLTMVLAGAKATALEGTTGFGGINEADTLDVTAGFSKDVVGNAAITDGVADAPIDTGAVTYVVTKTADTHDGSCDTADCSLREAISAANANIGTDTITLAAATYTLTRTAGADNDNSDGDLDITESVTINGDSITTTLIDGNAGVLNERILDIIAGAATVTLNDLALQNANSGSGTGAGIYHQGTTLDLTRVAIKNNTTSGHGAGISSVTTNTITMTDVELSGNSATGTGNGGAIYAIGPTVTWTGGVASGNSASNGGSIRNSSDFTATNVTFSGNSATSSGPAFTTSGGTTTLTNVTISNHSGFPAYRRNGGTINISNSIIGDNPGGNCFGSITSGGYNLETITSTCSFAGTGDQNSVTSGNLNMGALASNGGLFQTHALAAGSFALDQIPNGTNGCGTTVTTDVRGTARPQNASCDVGAYEYVVVGVAISGTVYTDEGTTPIADGATVRLIVNGSSVGTDTTVTGAYSINASVSATDAMIVYIDGHASDGTTVTVSNGNALAGLNIYADRLIVRHDNGGTLTNANMTTALGAYSDAEILYTTDGSDNLTVGGSATELYVWTGDTYAPGATIDTVHMDIVGTLDAAANAINVSGSWDVDAAGVFSSTGTVTFDAASGTNTITPGGVDVNHDFQNIVFNDAAGSATFQLAGAIDVDGDFTVTDGIVNTTGSNYAVIVGGNFSQAAAGQVEANSSTITVAGSLSVDGSIDSTDYNNASIVINGAGSSITYNNLTGNWYNGFSNLTAGQSGVTDTLNSTLSILNLLSVGSGELADAGATEIFLTGAGPNVLSFDPASNLTITQLTLNSASTLNLPTLTNGYDCDIMLAANGMTVNQTGDVTINGSRVLFIHGYWQPNRAVTYNTNNFALNVGGDLRVGSGGDTLPKTFNAGSSAITVGRHIIVAPVGGGSTQAVFNPGTSTVTLNGTADQTVTSSGSAFNNLTLNNTGAGGSDDIIIADAINVNGALTITDGDLDISTNDPTVNTAAALTVGASGSIDVTARTANWTFDGTTTLTDSSAGQDFEDVVVNGTSLTLGSNAKVQTMTVSAGTLGLGSSSYVLEIDGTGTPLSNSGTFTAGTSTVKYTGTTTATNIATLPYSSLQLTPTAATTYSLTGHLTGGNALTGDVTIEADATLTTTGSNYNITLAGDWANSGSLTAGTGTVTLNGTTQNINGSTTFYNLTKSVAAADTLTLEATETTTIASGGTVTLNGASGQLLTLASSTGSSAWNFVLTDATVTKAIDYVSVSWSDASGSHATQKPIAPTNSTDGGDTTDWFASGSPTITVTKMSLVISDPFNGGSNPKRIPGAVIEYMVSPSNSGDASPDANSVFVTDPIDTTMVEFYATGGVSFTDGTTSSALALGAVTYSSTASPGPYVYDYTPLPDGDGYDSSITSIKITTTGTFAFGGVPDPSFTLKFRVRIQ